MKKLFLFISTFGLITIAAAQNPTFNNPHIAVSIGPELNIPQHSGYTIGYGATGKLEAHLIKAFSLSLTGGYTQMHYRRAYAEAFATPSNDHYIPLKAGIKYYPDTKVYFEGEAGAVLDNNAGQKNLATYSLGTGFIIPFQPESHQAVDVGLRYESWSRNRLQQFAIRVAYRLAW
ncbi:hypothetical protein HH214_04050 [Mucilaginibacter robiniae]|uniref:Outer membrane protein beta-barrel domain-containing protein n=1 Tax=Mucilaginibacter robiniae TaxID=2728022 RepID=A0A7L5DYC4_9SPHI|nr:hypothetical protein [Mucilaginibacter robiniae]QJD95107.1 hypothetical protein HH214_04050 [Mucilaginibacter robiniae]